MRVAIFGAKYKNDKIEISDFRSNIKKILTDLNVKDVDDSYFVDDTYFNTNRDQDAENGKLFEMIHETILKSDAVIIESTRISEGIGVISGIAYSLSKPRLVLYDMSNRTAPPSAVEISSTYSSEKGKANSKVKTYRTQQEFSKHLKTFIRNVKESMSSKFFIELDGSMTKYIDWTIYRGEATSKVDVIRQAMEDKMINDDEWKEFISTQKTTD